MQQAKQKSLEKVVRITKKARNVNKSLHFGLIFLYRYGIGAIIRPSLCLHIAHEEQAEDKAYAEDGDRQERHFPEHFHASEQRYLLIFTVKLLQGERIVHIALQLT